MIRVGFSTRTKSIFSRLIRWFTGSSVSHAWLVYDDAFFGEDMVIEATEVGFRLIPLANFKAEGNDVVAVVEPKSPLDVGLRAARTWIGESYDFGGLLGASVVILGRWLKRKWRNPLDSPRSMFCSEAVVMVLQASSYPGAEKLDPSATTPQDLLNFLAPDRKD